MKNILSPTWGRFAGSFVAAKPQPLLLGTLLTLGTLSVNAGGYHCRPTYCGWGWGFYPSVSIGLGTAPYYAPAYYPAYSSYPAYGGNYVQTRPNYAVTGTLLGALTGGLIGDSIHHQGWEGAGIGAAAGLVLGGLAEYSARKQERAYSNPPVSYAQPQPSAAASTPTFPDAPIAPAAPTIPVTSSVRTTTTAPMSGANALFGR